MLNGQNGGHGEESHSVDSAALAIEKFLSGDEPEEKEPEDREIPEGSSEEHEGASEETDEEEPTSGTEEESDEDEEEQEEAKPEPRKFRVKVDGQELEVTEDEVLKGYSRTADYTRKSQALAEERKTFSTEAEAVRAERRDLATRLTDLHAALQSLTTEPDWDKLRREDPALFAETHKAWQDHTQRLKAVQDKRDEAIAAAQRDESNALQTRITAERERLLEAVPAWKDDAVRDREKQEVRAYAQKLGYTDDDLSNVIDHRAFVMLRKAMLFDRSEAAQQVAAQKAKEKIDKAVKVVQPGPSGEKKPKTTELTRRKQRLAKTGSVDDAAAALELLI